MSTVGTIRFKSESLIHCSFSPWHETFAYVTQGIVLEPLLTNMYISNSFLMITDTAACSFADDTSIFVVDCCLDKI